MRQGRFPRRPGQAILLLVLSVLFIPAIDGHPLHIHPELRPATSLPPSVPPAQTPNHRTSGRAGAAPASTRVSGLLHNPCSDLFLLLVILGLLRFCIRILLVIVGVGFPSPVLSSANGRSDHPRRIRPGRSPGATRLRAVRPAATGDLRGRRGRRGRRAIDAARRAGRAAAGGWCRAQGRMRRRQLRRECLGEQGPRTQQFFQHAQSVGADRGLRVAEGLEKQRRECGPARSHGAHELSRRLCEHGENLGPHGRLQRRPAR